MDGIRTIDAAIICDRGRIRDHNEDSWYFDGRHPSGPDTEQSASMQKTGKAAGSLWAVCDGIGGQTAGETASYTAVSGMPELQRYLQGREFESVIQSWIRQASEAVRKKTGGGTTLAMLYCMESGIQTAHAGDSRIYRWHEGKLIRVTRDHTRAEMLVTSGSITAEEAEKHPERHVLTRYLGMDSEDICSATVSEKTDYVPGDRYLICSDGVSDSLNDKVLATLLRGAESSFQCAETIRDAVYAAGAWDNLTLLVLDIR